MKVENVFPEYKNAHERAKSVQEAYTELQIIFYNIDKQKCSSNKEQIVKFKKGN
jgi:hypothetical protein